MHSIYGLKTRMCTWEILTGFEENLSQENLVEMFSKDFFEIHETPIFWKMISFNSSNGRHHRYLVILKEEKEPLVTPFRLFLMRVVPKFIFLYALADREMRSNEGYGNYRFVALYENTLFILIFFEGRLCHWSEERGYNNSQKNLLQERIKNIDEFIKKDSLYSQGDIFKYSPIYNIADNADLENWYLKKTKNLGYYVLKKAAKDPFWKGLHLEKSKQHNLSNLFVILFVILAVIFYGIYLYKTPPILNPEAPKLLDYPSTKVTKELKEEIKFKELKKNEFVENKSCSKLSLSLRGVVENQVFMGLLNENFIQKKTGDSIGDYLVQSISRDRVVLKCHQTKLEVVNGSNL